MPIPDDVREAAIQKLGLFFNDRSIRESVADAALSALEVAGYVVVRDEGAYPRAFVEFALRHTWPERAEAHGHAAVHDIIKHHPFAQMYAPTPGRAVVDLAAEPQFRLTLSEEARAALSATQQDATQGE